MTNTTHLLEIKTQAGNLRALILKRYTLFAFTTTVLPTTFLDLLKQKEKKPLLRKLEMTSDCRIKR